MCFRRPQPKRKGGAEKLLANIQSPRKSVCRIGGQWVMPGGGLPSAMFTASSAIEAVAKRSACRSSARWDKHCSGLSSQSHRLYATPQRCRLKTSARRADGVIGGRCLAGSEWQLWGSMLLVARPAANGRYRRISPLWPSPGELVNLPQTRPCRGQVSRNGCRICIGRTRCLIM